MDETPFPPLARAAPGLLDEERAVYEWQLRVRGFGEEGQRRLKGTTALVTRVGGLGGPVALQLVAAGLGRIVLAHGGALRPSDLNRQILMSSAGLGASRVEQAARRLRELNPRVEIEAVPENATEENVAGLVARADIVFDCAPLFGERFLLNREIVRQGKPMIDLAMFAFEGRATTILPGRTACLACIHPETPPEWKREFPVFGAVSATVGSIGATEGIRLAAGMGAALAGKMLYLDLERMDFRKFAVERRPDCPVCG